MKPNKKTLLLSAVVAASCVMACSDDEPAPAITAPEGGIVATINNTEWVSSQATAIIQNGTIYIAGSHTAGSHLVLQAEGESTGTYTLETLPKDMHPQSSLASFTPENSSTSNPIFSSMQKNDPAVGGTISISEIDTENQLVSGTFEVTLSRYKDNTGTEDSLLIINQGSFNKIPYGNNGNGNTDNTAAALVDNQVFEIGQVSGISQNGQLILAFNSATSTSDGISLMMPAEIKPGQYEFGSLGSSYFAIYYRGTTTQFPSESGQLVISKHDTSKRHIEGTFHFQAAPLPGSGGTGSHLITEGEFSLTYE